MDCSPPGPVSMGFPRQEPWSGQQFLLQGTFPTQGSNPHLLHWWAVFTTEPPGQPQPWIRLRTSCPRETLFPGEVQLPVLPIHLGNCSFIERSGEEGAAQPDVLVGMANRLKHRQTLKPPHQAELTFK